MKNYSLTLDTKKTIPHITVAEYGITFPSEACKLLNFASYIHVFYDDDSKVVAFKPCEKDEDAYSFYKPNVGTPGNVRWTCRRPRNHIAKLLGVEPSKHGVKIYGFYSDEDDMLIFELKKQPKK
jgi:hypothetical protein